MKIRVIFQSKDVQGNEIGEIHEEELKENLIMLITRFLGKGSMIHGREIDAWEVTENQLRLCVDEDGKDITCYTCKVEAELCISLTVVKQRTLEGDHWSTNLLRGIIQQKRGEI